MKPKLPTQRFLAIVVTALFFNLNAFSKDYYFDADNGNDDAPTCSKTTPWQTIYQANSIKFQPGDKILFKRGCAWTRPFRPQGNESAPIGSQYITIGAYDGATAGLPNPIINGGGASDETAGLHGGAAILLKNQSYWIIENITVTNTPASPSVSNIGYRQGIKIVADDSPGTNTGELVQNIIIRNVKVRNVHGRYHMDKGGKLTGGICLFLYRPDGYSNTIPVKARFNTITIEKSTIEDITRCGIFTNASATLNPDNSFNTADYPIDNLVIRRNIIQRCTGDGVVVRFADAPLIQSNRAVENHNGVESGPLGKDYEGYVGHGVALWCRSTNNAKFEWNDVCGTKGVLDGTAFDADYRAINTVFQYNYSHDNQGGFVIFMKNHQTANPGTVVRFNISQNDGLLANRTFYFSRFLQEYQYNSSAQIYNNTIYFDDQDTNPFIVSNNISSQTKFLNNIFIKSSTGAGVIKGTGENAEWTNNHFENFSNVPTTNSVGSSYLKSPGDGPTSLLDTGTRSSTGAVHAAFDAYKITGSITDNKNTYKTGAQITANGGKDFYGLSVSTTPNKGAHNGCLNCTSGLAAKNSNDLLSFDAAAKAETLQLLYPNPVSDKLYLSNLPDGIYAIAIIDNEGRRVLKSQLVNGALDVSTLAPGMYTLIFPNDRHIKSFQFIKAN